MYLKNTSTGEVFCYNERLASKPGYVKQESLHAAPVNVESPEAATQRAIEAAAKKQSRTKK